MRRLTILVITAACLYSLYWFVGSSRIESGAKVAQTFALSYRPTRMIAVVADSQQLRIGDQVIDISSSRLRASGAVTAGASLPLKEVTAEAETLGLSSNYGWQLGLEKVLIALRPTADEEQRYDIYLGAETVKPSQGAALTDVKFDGRIQLDRPLDRHLMSNISPLIEAIEVKDVLLIWDRLHLTGAGSLTVDGAGVPFGEITFRTSSWQDLVPLLSASGIIAPQFQIMTMTILQSLAGADGSLALPLRFENGNMQLGPIPLGPAPRLR